MNQTNVSAKNTRLHARYWIYKTDKISKWDDIFKNKPSKIFDLLNFLKAVIPNFTWSILEHIVPNNKIYENHCVKINTIVWLTLSWRRPISYWNQSIDLLRKSMDWFLYDIGLRHERVKQKSIVSFVTNSTLNCEANSGHCKTSMMEYFCKIS